MKDKRIVGPDGKPANEQEDETTLPLEIQAFIEARVNGGVETARELLRHEANAAQRAETIRGWIKFAIIFFLNCLVGVLLWVFGSSELRDLTRKYVTENMNRPTLDAAAREVVTNRMGTFVAEKLDPLIVTVGSIRSNLSNAHEEMRRLQEEQRVVALIGRAEALDGEAFEELSRIASSTNKFASLAGAMVRQVRRALAYENVNPVHEVPMFVAGQDQYVGPFTSEDLAALLAGSQPEGAVNLVAEQNRTLFVPKLVEIAQSSEDLLLRKRISLALSKLSGVTFEPWDKTVLAQWWSQQKSNYTDWPFDSYREGIASFRRCNYREALSSFQGVLAIDPGADASRALSVACAAEIGDAARAEQLNTNYAEKNGRWEQWAKAKLLLVSGSTNEATRQLAMLLNKFPLMDGQGFVAPGSHVFRNVDWSLFSALRTEGTNAPTNGRSPSK